MGTKYEIFKIFNGSYPSFDSLLLTSPENQTIFIQLTDIDRCYYLMQLLFTVMRIADRPLKVNLGSIPLTNITYGMVVASTCQSILQ